MSPMDEYIEEIKELWDSKWLTNMGAKHKAFESQLVDCYKGRVAPGKTPVAEYIAKRVLTLPLYADLALEDVDRICSIILED